MSPRRGERRHPTAEERDERVSLYPWTGEEVARIVLATDPKTLDDSPDEPPADESE